jgi:YgiT-type zinc finger domain-containing protein
MSFMQCGECGREMRSFAGVSFLVEHLGRAKTVSDLSGLRCVCGEVIFDHESAKRYAEASDELTRGEK